MRILVTLSENDDGAWLRRQLGGFFDEIRADVWLGRIGATTQKPSATRPLHVTPESSRTLPLRSSVLDDLVLYSQAFDLMLLGHLTSGAWSGLLGGAKVVSLMQRTQCALWVPHRRDEPLTRPRCLVGVDVNGRADKQVIRMAGDWAAIFGGSLDAFYAIMDPSTPQDRRDAAAERLETMMRQMVLPEVQGEALIREGHPRTIAAELSADYDILFLGNRDQAGLRGLLEGPLSTNIQHQALCDVLTLPTRLLS